MRKRDETSQTKVANTEGEAMKRRFLSSIEIAMTITVLLFAASPKSFAQQSPGLSEMRIAEKHAAAAANAKDLQQVKAELQRALNCLVGRNANEYRTSVGDTCNGASALQKLPAGSINKIRVQKAVRLAEVGVTFHDFDPAHYTARAVQAVLHEGSR